MKKVTLLVLLFATVFFVSSCVLINRRPPTVNIPDQVINEGEVLSINLFDFIKNRRTSLCSLYILKDLAEFKVKRHLPSLLLMMIPALGK